MKSDRALMTGAAMGRPSAVMAARCRPLSMQAPCFLLMEALVGKLWDILAGLCGFAEEGMDEKKKADRAESEEIHRGTQAANDEARAREAARAAPLPPDARRPR